jgi:hypothetical protein
MFFSRLSERDHSLRYVLQGLDRETLVLVCQRIGYTNAFDMTRPSMFYRLRMWRADEHRVALKLFRIMMTSSSECFKYFAVNGEEKKVSKGPSELPDIVPVCWRKHGTYAN